MKRTNFSVVTGVLCCFGMIILGLIVTLYITLKDMTQLNLFIDFPTLIIILLFVIPAFLSSGLQKDFLLIFKIQKNQ